MEDDLDTIRASVEELDAAQLIQDGIGGVISHVVGDNRGQAVTLQRVHATLQQNFVFAGEEGVDIRDLSAMLTRVIHSMVIESLPDTGLDFRNRFL